MTILHDRWPRVPEDYDEACRFAAEYEIRGRHAFEEVWYWKRGQSPGDGTNQADPLRRLVWSGQAPRVRVYASDYGSKMSVRVTLEASHLKWEFSLFAGSVYEDPGLVIERFSNEHMRLYGEDL